MTQIGVLEWLSPEDTDDIVRNRRSGGICGPSWGRLGAPHLEPTLSERRSTSGGIVEELAKRDTAQIALMCAVGEMSGPVLEDRNERI